MTLVVAVVLAGLLLQVRRPFRVGHEVEPGEHHGRVEDVNLRTVVVTTYGGLTVCLPDPTVLKNAIVDLTRTPLSRTSLSVGVAYDTDPARAREVLLAACAAAGGVVGHPPAEVWAEELADSAVVFAVRCWHDAAIASRWRVRSAVALSVKAALDGAGITIPFPQRTVWLRGAGHTGAPELSVAVQQRPRGREAPGAEVPPAQPPDTGRAGAVPGSQALSSEGGAEVAQGRHERAETGGLDRPREDVRAVEGERHDEPARSQRREQQPAAAVGQAVAPAEGRGVVRADEDAHHRDQRGHVDLPVLDPERATVAPGPGRTAVRRPPRRSGVDRGGGGGASFPQGRRARRRREAVVDERPLPGGAVHPLPDDLQQALATSASALAAWWGITPLARNEFICWVQDAKRVPTRERRVGRTREELEEGMRRPCCWPGCGHRERTGG